MAAGLNDCLGNYYHVSRICQDLCWIHGGSSSPWSCRGWLVARHGASSPSIHHISNAESHLQVLYLSGMYTRGEMAFRIGLFFTSASLSGAFGGLLARGLSAIGPHTHLVGWRWIFIVEGLLVRIRILRQIWQRLSSIIRRSWLVLYLTLVYPILLKHRSFWALKSENGLSSA